MPLFERNIHKIFRQDNHEHLRQPLACGWKPADPPAGGLVTSISDVANSTLLQSFRSRPSRADSPDDLQNRVRAALCRHPLKARGWGKQQHTFLLPTGFISLAGVKEIQPCKQAIVPAC